MKGIYPPICDFVIVCTADEILDRMPENNQKYGKAFQGIY